MQATVKGLSTWATDDGGGYQAVLCIDGRKVAVFTQDGRGGPLCWELEDRVRFWAWAEQYGVSEQQVIPCDTPIDTAAAELVDAYEHARQLRRWCRTKTLFTLPGDEPGTFRTIKAPFSERAKAFILGKYPNATIINEAI